MPVNRAAVARVEQRATAVGEQVRRCVDSRHRDARERQWAAAAVGQGHSLRSGAAAYRLAPESQSRRRQSYGRRTAARSSQCNGLG